MIKRDKKLMEKYNGYAYMYAEYPNKNFWSKDFKEGDFKRALKELPSHKADSPTMLYVHTPFCQDICSYCSCYKVGTKDYRRVESHTESLLQEIELLRKFTLEASIDLNFKQIHLGGGSPTYLRRKEFDKLVAKIGTIAEIGDLDEFAIEIDPRHVDKNRMLYYHDKGINRVSFGVQDFDLEVQRAVNRVQPPELTESLLVSDVRKYFNSVSFDILHGLPKQTSKSFRETIDKVIEFSPDRVAMIRFNYNPISHPNQRRINPEDLPTEVEREKLFSQSEDTLLKNGYVRIGLEHFVKPVDKLVDAWNSGNINWNMGGYSPGDSNKIVGVGPSSSGRITDSCYSQNIIDLKDYDKTVLQGKFPILRGHKLTEDDLIRRDVTIGLRSKLHLDFRAIEKKHGIIFGEYFADEIKQLDEFVEEGIIEISGERIQATDKGMPFVSFVCMNFDKYHQDKIKCQK